MPDHELIGLPDPAPSRPAPVADAEALGRRAFCLFNWPDEHAAYREEHGDVIWRALDEGDRVAWRRVGRVVLPDGWMAVPAAEHDRLLSAVDNLRSVWRWREAQIDYWALEAARLLFDDVAAYRAALDPEPADGE